MKRSAMRVGLIVNIKGIRCATNGRIAAQGPIMTLLPNGCVVDCGYYHYHVNATQVCPAPEQP